MGFLYIVKNGDLTKIGITTNIGRRMGQLKPSKICTVVELEEARSLEKKLHKRFKGSRLPQSEYFRLSDSSLRKACAQAMEAGVPISLEKVPLEKAKTQVKKGRGRAKPPKGRPRSISAGKAGKKPLSALVIGGAIGVFVGWSLARNAQSSRSSRPPSPSC